MLAFDEMKIVAKVAYNSKSHEIYGMSAEMDQLSSIADLFDITEEDRSLPAEFALRAGGAFARK